jgi:threonine dehydratase
MRAMMLAGVDGCPAGWVAVVAGAGFADPRVRVLPRLDALFEPATVPDVVAIDMPIGLPDRVGAGGRGPEAALRPHLGRRQSSVFSVPSREAVYARDYAEACAAAQATSDPPRKVSKQCFHLFPRIREVDTLLRAQPGLRPRVFESHPEGAFMRMNGGRPLLEPKKVKSRPHGPGLDERRALLLAAGLPQALVEAKPPRGAGADDLLDACACLVTAHRLTTGTAISFPAVPGRDEHGLAIAIWA